jgi:hypothetical protein
MTDKIIAELAGRLPDDLVAVPPPVTEGLIILSPRSRG